MEKFCKHIEKVLAHHDYVIVPDLGGFVVQQQSAQIFINRISPPLATVAFNPLMHHSDGILAIEIARSHKISYRLAVEYIQNEIESIQFRLKTNGSVKLGSLGVLIKNEQNNLEFQPSQDMNFLPYNLGLSDLYISARQFRNDVESTKNTIPFTSNNFYKYAAAASLFFCLFFVSNRVSDTKQADYASFVPVSFPKPIENIKVQTIDTITFNTGSKNDTATTKIIKEESKTIDRKQIDPIKCEESKFHVVVASLANLSSAELYCKSLHDNKFDKARVLTPTKSYRVSVQSFKDKQEALKFMQNLRETDSRFENAWVYCE